MNLQEHNVRNVIASTTVTALWNVTPWGLVDSIDDV
jgi:hypothetical protein